MISLKDMLQTMDKIGPNGKPIPFSIQFVTANRKTKSGGEVIYVDKAIISKNRDKKVKESMDPVPTGSPKNPNHWENSTRNIFILASSQTRKVHIRLITQFNGQKVYW